MSPDALRIEPLARHPEALATLAKWFEAAWPSYYGGSGPGNASDDLAACCKAGELPIGMVAFLEGELCGIAALKADSIASHSHLAPWAAAGLVKPECRRQGIGAALVGSLEHLARELGYPTIYCATNTASRLLERRGWRFLEHAESGGERVSVYLKPLGEAACRG